MIKEALRSVPAEKAATETEIIDAIKGLTPVETFRLEKYSRLRIHRIGPRAAEGRDHEDLMQEAYTKFLSRERKWNKDKPFTCVLLGAIKSISNHWATQHDPTEPRNESELLITRQDGSKRNLFEEIASACLDPASQVEIEQTLAQIDQIIAGDDEALLVIDGLSRQMSGPEIKKDLGLTQTEFETIIRRIRRKILRQLGDHYA